MTTDSPQITQKVPAPRTPNTPTLSDDESYEAEATEKMAQFRKVHDGEKFSIQEKMVAEMIGTAILVFFGCGSVCVGVYTNAFVGLGQSTTIWSLGASLAIYSSGSVSGGHLNPAVSLAFAIIRPRDFSWRNLLPYWIAQLCGAFFAGALNYGIFHTAISNHELSEDIERGMDGNEALGFGSYYSNDVAGSWHAFLIEIVGTALLTVVIFSSTHSRNNVPSAAVPALVGAAIGSIIALIGALSGGAINPARDFGPRIVTVMAGWGSSGMKGAWIYIFGPLIGGPIGALISDKILRF